MLQQYAIALAMVLLVRHVQTQVALNTSCTGRALRVASTPFVRCKAPTTLAVLALNPMKDLAGDKAFDDSVRRALTHLADPTKLARSPLVQLALVTRGLAEHDIADTCLHRAAILTELLTGMIKELRPHQQEGSHTIGAWRFYNCLYYPYVARISRRLAPTALRELRERRERDGSPRTEQEQVVEWLLQVDEDTYYKWQRRASDTIALSLREREHTTSGAGGMCASVA